MACTDFTILLVSLVVMAGSGTWAKKNTLPFIETTKDALGIRQDTRLAAFTDLNTDKRTDLITVDISEGVLQALYSGDEKTMVTSIQLLNLDDAANLTTVVPGDFDGDLVTDFLLIYKVNDGSFHRMQLCFGSRSTLHYEICIDINRRSKGEPIILDYNADMKPDILFENSDGNLTLLISDQRNFSIKDIDNRLWGPLLHPQSSAFVDLNRDLAADIAFTTEKGLLIILNEEGVFDFEAPECLIKWTVDSNIGMVSFTDYDSDSFMDIIVSSTKDKQTTVYVMTGDVIYNWLQAGCSTEVASWAKLPVTLKDGKEHTWSLSQADSWLRVGDVDNDGYADLLVMLTNSDSGDTRPFILRNTDCNDTCGAGHRTYVAMWDWLPAQYNTTQTAFLDMYNDGMLDVLYNAQHDGYTELHFLKNSVAKQACFLTVQIGSGLCSYEDESSCSKPYTNIVGPTVQYNSTHPDGTSAFGIATQLTQSTNGALQIPYIQFGLGTTPNFIDALTVGVARKKDQESWTETWKTIVPNSHLVVVPRPPDQPDRWLMHLYVTPSHLVMVTGLVILSLCAVIAITISLLHLKERHQDKKVKLLEAQRFHFNAM